MEMQRILAVDPGSLCMGYAFLEGNLHRAALLDAGILRAPRSWEASARFGKFAQELRALIDRHSPRGVAIESSFHGRNTHALIRLAEARGVVLGLAGTLSIPVADYAPAVVKKALTGNGNATKESVALVVRALFPRVQVESGSDLTDAVAIAVCHLRRSGLSAQASALEAASGRRPGRARPRRSTNRGEADRP